MRACRRRGWASRAFSGRARCSKARTVCSRLSRIRRDGDYDVLTEDFGRKWCIEGITFKPYATGTMNQPYIDCAVRLSKKGIKAEDVTDVLCETAEGYVHRLWDPLESKHRPANEYAAKFSTPFNVAVAFMTGGAGLAAFTEETVRDPNASSRSRRKCATSSIRTILIRRPTPATSA